jgi:hypothetical protein
MGLLQSQRIPLGLPSTETIQDVHQTVRRLHLEGHGWHMWEQASEEEATIIPGTSMRKYVKSWVTERDFLRLYPGEECEIEVSSWKPSYQEPEGLQERQGTASVSPDASANEDSAEASTVLEEKPELVASVGTTGLGTSPTS